MPFGYDIIQTSNCVNSSCTIVFTDFPKNNDLYHLLLVAKNHSVILKEFNLTIGKHIIKLRYKSKHLMYIYHFYTAYLSKQYFIWTLNSTSCQQYSVQCTATFQNITDGTKCSIRHTANHEIVTVFSVPLNTQHFLPYINPGIINYFGFSAMVKDHFLIMDSIKIGWCFMYTYT